MYGCSNCENRWGGYNTAHCGACHLTFTSIEAFDLHRTGSHAKGTRSCTHPIAAGLELDPSRGYECYRRVRPDLVDRPKGLALLGVQDSDGLSPVPAMAGLDDRMNDALHDPDELLWQIAVSHPLTIDVPETATIAVTDDRSTHMLDGAVIAWWR